MLKKFIQYTFLIFLLVALFFVWKIPVENENDVPAYTVGPTPDPDGLLTSVPMGERTALFARMKSDTAGVFFWYAPQNFSGTLPMVVVLHGAPGRAYAAAFLTDPAVQAAHPSFILVPTAPGPSWLVPEKIDSVTRLVEDLAAHYPVDRSRIYIIGCSLGGSGVYSAVSRHPDVFAAAVPISGEWRVEDTPKMASVPMSVMGGSLDKVIPPANSREIARRIYTMGGHVYYTEFPDMGHQCPSERYYTSALWDWMFSQKKQAVTAP